jgi:hypothetical protein
MPELKKTSNLARISMRGKGKSSRYSMTGAIANN